MRHLIISVESRRSDENAHRLYCGRNALVLKIEQRYGTSLDATGLVTRYFIATTAMGTQLVIRGGKMELVNVSSPIAARVHHWNRSPVGA
jgi:hypothetical protein